MASRFDYVQYDQIATASQAVLKKDVQALEGKVNAFARVAPINVGHAMKALEEFYMWMGKLIRDDQIHRNGTAPLQEGRGNG